MTITHQTVVDSQGKPAAALIPWSEFLLIRTILEGGEVLINVRGTLGGCAVVPPALRGYNIAREVAGWRPVEQLFLLALRLG